MKMPPDESREMDVAQWSARNEAAVVGVKVRLRHRHRINWRDADWTQSDSAIARALSCSVQGVRFARERLGKPQSPASSRRGKFIVALGRTESERAAVGRTVAWNILNTRATCESEAARLGVSIGSIWHLYASHTTPEERIDAKRRKISAGYRDGRRVIEMRLQTREEHRKERAERVRAKARANIAALLENAA